MSKVKQFATMDGNEAAASVAFRTNEVIAIYPITPSTPMGELSDAWSSQNKTNIWGLTPQVQEMQSEGGASGAVHGALQGGALTTTFTASQGLLLMIPNMFKIAGELTSAVFHVAARSLATHALSIFGDHSDVMATRSTGWGMLFSGSVQEVHDMALIAQAATLKSRVPFIHAFDGFRTSHEINKIEVLDDDVLRGMIDLADVQAHRKRALSPDRPVIRGTAQNPDVFFQSREAINPFYDVLPEIVQASMDRFAGLVGRKYKIFDYVGAPEPERVIILMGSGAETAEETIHTMNLQGENVGIIKVRMFRPFSPSLLLQALPESVKQIAVLDRTKEPAAAGEPLYQDVIASIFEAASSGQRWSDGLPTVIGGRYGLGSKEFTPPMVKGVFDELLKESPRRSFSVGIIDDVTQRHLDSDLSFSTETPEVTRGIFWGLGSDGTVGANKNSIKIIGEKTDNYAQGYFVYDSKKSGARTISHLRFGPNPIHSTYLIEKASFVGIHQFGFLEKYPVLEQAQEGATVLINSPFGPDDVWEQLPTDFQETLIAKKLRLFVIDAYEIAKRFSLGNRINTVMQAGFFALTDILPREEAIKHIKDTITMTYGKRGEFVVRMNHDAVDASVKALHEVKLQQPIQKEFKTAVYVAETAPKFVHEVTTALIEGRGDQLPVSMMPVDGTFPTGTTQWEKRNLAQEIPVWEEDLCIQCGKCVMICPHAVIRAKLTDNKALESAPEGFKSSAARWKGKEEQLYTLQVSPDDCTGCRLCVEICPVKDKSQVKRKAINMHPQRELRQQGRNHWNFFTSLAENLPTQDDLHLNKVKDIQLLEPLFEFSGACAGCGETPYLKLLSQLYGDRSTIANATGCSSIYGGNLPTTPWKTNAEGRGPAWSNSLFEDNAEFGLGMRLALDKQIAYARQLLAGFGDTLGQDTVDAILNAPQDNDAELKTQRDRITALRQQLAGIDTPQARDLEQLADVLAEKQIWIVGGDGWAYDIGYGGLDHVLASGLNVNVLVLDTEVYSNTGGQASKATQIGAIAKFAAGGKETPKKDLGMLAMSYKSIYVASVVMGSNEAQTLKAFREAASYPGPSLIIAYSPCIAHGFDMSKSIDQQKRIVDSGLWMLYRYDPRLSEQGKNPLQIDSKAPKLPLKQYLYEELRYRMLQQIDPERARTLLQYAQENVDQQWERYRQMAALDVTPTHPTTEH